MSGVLRQRLVAPLQEPKIQPVPHCLKLANLGKLGSKSHAHSDGPEVPEGVVGQASFLGLFDEHISQQMKAVLIAAKFSFNKDDLVMLPTINEFLNPALLGFEILGVG